MQFQKASFSNTSESSEEISTDLRAFLDYVGGKRPENPFVDALDAAVQKAKQNQTWKREYMRLQLKLDDAYESGRKNGFQQGEQVGFQKAKQEFALVKTVFQKHIAGCSNEDIADQLSINLQTVQDILED